MIGTTSLGHQIDSGQFFCPTCQVNERYSLRGRRIWLTIYFVPVLPLTTTRPRVYCRQCRSRWDPTILTLDDRSVAAARRQQFAAELVRGCVSAIQSTRTVTAADRDLLLSMADEFGLAMTPDELDHIVFAAGDSKFRAREYLQSVCGPWTHRQRVEATQWLFGVTTDQDEIDPATMRLMIDLRDIFDLTDAEYRRAIEDSPL